jgi:nitronate monooxygenase
MMVEADAYDVVMTNQVTGLNANFIKQSLIAHGIDPNSSEQQESNFDHDGSAWASFFSAGHGIGVIHDVLKISELVDRLTEEYQQALTKPIE